MRVTQLDKAIASIDADIAVLQAAKQRLVAQQAAVKKPTRKPRAIAPVVREDRSA